MRQPDRIPSGTDGRDIVLFVLAMLTALAIFSFVWAGIRISEIRASSGLPFAMSL
jgi:hypothetical protein